jgi:multidrug efflux system membrane fusion protein
VLPMENRTFTGVRPLSLKHTIIGSGLLSISLLGVAGCNRQQAQAGPMQMPPPLVTVADAKAQDVPIYLDEIGKCSARESVTVMPQVAGIITERHFEDGADLKKGQLLFSIDPRPFQATLDSAIAQLEQAKAAREFAKLELDRYAAVANTRAISKSDYDTKKNAMDVAEAQVAAAQAAVEAAQLNVGYCSIVSPIEGRAGARLVDAGNVVKANETALLLIQRLDPIYSDFTITERDLPSVQEFMKVGTLKTLVRLPIDSAGRGGDLTFLDNAVQDGTGTVKLRAIMPNKDHHFWPGQFVDVKLILKTQKDAVLIPAAASQISQQGPYVYVVKKDGTADLRPVTLGQRQGDDIVVIKGVTVGERVIVTGQMTVRPGAPVRIDTPKPPGGPSTEPGEDGKADPAPGKGGKS